jgi:hypothetical protein
MADLWRKSRLPTDRVWRPPNPTPPARPVAESGFRPRCSGAIRSSKRPAFVVQAMLHRSNETQWRAENPGYAETYDARVARRPRDFPSEAAPIRDLAAESGRSGRARRGAYRCCRRRRVVLTNKQPTVTIDISRRSRCRFCGDSICGAASPEESGDPTATSAAVGDGCDFTVQWDANGVAKAT